MRDAKTGRFVSSKNSAAWPDPDFSAEENARLAQDVTYFGVELRAPKQPQPETLPLQEGPSLFRTEADEPEADEVIVTRKQERVEPIPEVELPPVPEGHVAVERAPGVTMSPNSDLLYIAKRRGGRYFPSYYVRSRWKDVAG